MSTAPAAHPAETEIHPAHVPEPFLLTTRILDAPTRRDWRPHVHAEHLLIWAQDGPVSVSVAGQTWALLRGYGLWIPAGTTHLGITGRGARFGSTYFVAGQADLFSAVTLVSVGAVQRELLLHLAETPMPAERRLRAQRVIMDLTLAVTPGTFAVPHPQDPRIRDLADRVLADPADDRSLESWAREYGVSERTMTRAFNAELGLNFARWRLLVRIRAALLLLGSGVPVAEAARLAGYSTPSAFSAAFRRVQGETPTEFLAGLEP
ncbi:helix-turn-helix domain-containing protein [Mycetocola spongiae]|uniref:helix-turn-helix domain-containing protein n=1 Tax=Mycetocola spongiae TaxID=2859226 RepID=UPI001CF2CACD|nr:AraC family transcriptional regulator [Mycetocola spongiae]UCR90311.1 AraC family transcriptional regulator [Mycetocola spongiae]